MRLRRIPGESYAALLERFARVGALVSMAVGAAVAIGWFFDVAALKSVLPGFATMKMNTACGLMAAGASLWIKHTSELNSRSYRAAQGLAVFVAALGGLTLAEDVFGLHLGIDQLIIREGPIAVETTNPGRMSPASSISFLFIGMALLSLKARSAPFAAWAHWLVGPPLLIPTLAIVGYGYGVGALYRVGMYSSVALHTALVLLILALSIIAADTKHGFTSIAASDSAGGVISRWLLPVIPVLLFFLGWIRLKGEEAGLYEFRFGLALMVMMSITVCMIAVAWVATVLHRTDGIRKVAETEIDSLNAALELRRSEERFRILVGGVKDYAIFMLDPKGYITSWNEGAERIKGYRADQIIGEHFSRFYTPEEIAAGKPAAELIQAAAEGKFEEEGWRLRKDGSRFWASVLITPLRDEEGEIRGFSKVTRDATERKNVEMLIVQQIKELSRSNADLQHFAYVASHDLQEPLRMVSSYVELLSRRYKGKLDANADEFIALALDGTARMTKLIGNLLTYSKVGETDVRLRNTSSEETLQKAMVNLRRVIADSGAVVTHDPLPDVMADEVQLTQLFQNLVGNAIKYQRHGIPKVHISAAANGDGRWSFSVRDNGIGIDPENFERVFGMFQRLNGGNEFAGTGIGLAICKKIVDRHGGNISVESQPGRGSTFHFSLAEGKTVN